MIQTQTGELLGSSFHRQSQKSIVGYLQREFGYSEELAAIAVYAHDCTSIQEAMSLFVLNDEGKYQHLFIKDEDQEHQLCRLCKEKESQHSQPYNKSTEQKIHQARKIQAQSQKDDDFDDMEFNLFMRRKSSASNKKSLFSHQNSFNCDICCMNYQEEQMVHLNGIRHGVCNSCMNSYLREEILNLRIQGIGCPHCGEVLTSEQIRGFVNRATFEKYQKFLINLEIQKNPNLRWCPNPKCSVVINVTSKKNLKCPKCQTKICRKCNREAHPKRSCDAVLQAQLKGLQNAKDIQKCKKCSALVEKVSGCNHMSCFVCSYEWCWLCGATYSDLHFSPLNPFGCAGLQDQNHARWGGCKIFLWRFMIALGFLIGIPVLLPIAMIVCGPATIFYTYRNAPRIVYGGCGRKVLYFILFIIVGLIMNPFFWIYFSGLGIMKGISLLKQWFQTRRQIHQASQQQLRRKLLMQNEIISEQV